MYKPSFFSKVAGGALTVGILGASACGADSPSLSLTTMPKSTINTPQVGSGPNLIDIGLEQVASRNGHDGGWRFFTESGFEVAIRCNLDGKVGGDISGGTASVRFSSNIEEPCIDGVYGQDDVSKFPEVTEAAVNLANDVLD